ncbi:MAG TPA: translocation/assembly module TamB domain-containing protein [Vicinamibacterales bacterium]|nr:translocation/assembly module TamB domain-containing protein [Vicinamibacterales bacterium]
MRRKGPLVLISAAGAMLLALVAAHTQPARALVLRRVVEALRTSYGVELRAEGLSYNLLTLSAELRGVQVASVTTPAEPCAAAEALAISFGARALLGDVSVSRLSIASPRIDIRRHGDGTDNLPRLSRGQSDGTGLLPPIRVDDLDVSFQQPSMSAQIRGAALQLTSAERGRVSATLEAQHGASITVGDRTIDVDAVTAGVDLEGERLDLRGLTASRPGAVLHASGSIALRGDASTADLTANGSSELQSWWTEMNGQSGPVGRVDVTARMTGSLSEPAIIFETASESLAWSDLHVSDVRARGVYRGGELLLDSVTLGMAGGTVEAHGAIVPGDPARRSRIEARWAQIDPRHIPGAARLAGIISRTGTAVVEWRPDATSVAPRFDVTATTGVVASGTTIPLVVHGWGQADRWRVKATNRDRNAVDVTATADIRLDPRRWQASTIDGRVLLRTADLPAAIRQAHALGVPADVDAGTAAGAVDIDATIHGTLGTVRSTGRIIGRALTLAGLPRFDLDAAFGVDVAGKTSSGTFHLLAPTLESATFPSQEDLTLGGSVIAAGTWSGPISDPAVVATLTGRDLTLGRAGPVSIAATGGTFDGVLKGPVTHISGRGKLTIGAVDIGGRGVGTVTADLTLSKGTLRVDAGGPNMTRLDASIGLEDPRPFEGRGTLSEFDIGALLGMTGLAGADPGAVRGRISSSFAFKGDLRNLSSATVSVDVAPIDATAFDVPITISGGLRARKSGGRVHLEDVAIAIGGLALRLGGTLATDRPAGKLVLDMGGDLGPLTPWLTRLSASDDVAAAGRITGHLETELSPAGLVTTGTIDTALSRLSKGERILARDVRAVIAFTGERVEMREATGFVLGGQLTAAGGAPLTWLNQWLPSGFRVAQPASSRPAALEGTASFDVPALVGLIGRMPPEGVGGSIELSAKLTASRPDPADITGELRLERAELSAGELRYVPSDVTRFRLSRGALTIEGFDLRGPGSRVVAGGSVGLGLLDGIETNLRLDVDTDLAIVGALLSGRATGRLAGSIELLGQAGALRVTSDATLSDATWLIPGQRILFAGWSGHIRLADQALSVAKLGGTVNGGSIRVDGRLPIEAGADGGGLTIVARDILIDVPRGLHSQLGADLAWQRVEQAGRLTGTVEITANRYTEPVTRILQLVNSLSSATRSSGESTLPPWLADTALDISVAVTDPILIDNSVSTVELMPDLRLAGTIQSPALSGRVDVVDEGRITIGGRAYRMRDSQVRFAPADGLVPTLDALGDTRIADYDVTIRISGTPDRIETSFSSVPPLGERDLQSLIVTGQTGEQAMQGRQSDDNFAAAAAATDILGFAGRFVGLDTVRIGAPDLDLVSKDVSTAQHLTVSKSLGSSFDLIFSDNLEEGSVTWVLVWKPTPVNEVRAFSSEEASRGIEFRRSMAFGPGSPTGTRTARRAAAERRRAIVGAVQITGAPGFSSAELSRRLELQAGDRFDVRRWIDDRHRLENFYLDRGYHRVRIASTRSEDADRSDVSLTYVIERGPQTVIDVTGDPIPDEVIDAMYAAWRGLPIPDVVRTEFERIAREGLARRGYYRPVLQLDFQAETPDLARVTVHVARGPQTKRLNVAWSGNRNVSNAELDALVAPHRAESAVWLDSQSLVWQVRQLYAGRGHLQAQVTVGEPAFEGTGATLPIAIDEGVLSRLAGVQLEGVDPARMKGATEALGLSIGEPFPASAPVEAARRLKAFYAGLGYRRAAVAHRLTTAEDGTVSIAWTVTEGPLYVVKDVNVVGAETTNDGLVRKAIALEPGDAMGESAIDTTRRNLYDIGSFRRVDFDFGDSAIQPGAPDALPLTLTIQAEELQRFQLKYGVQFTFDRSTGRGSGNALGGSVELRDRNFIGRAVQASVGAHWDPDLQIVGLVLSSPRMFGRRLRTNVYVRDRREQDVVDSASTLEGATLDDRRRELTLEQRWRPASAWELVWGYKFSSRRFLVEEHFDVGGLLAGPVVSVILDRRDSPFDASRGLFHSSSFQFGVPSLGSDLGYVRYLLRQSYYQPLGGLTAAGSVRYGTIQDYSGVAPISIIDLFFNAGGTNTVRGYPEDSLSAINVAGFALGGTELLVLNGELRFPITKRLGGAAFVDAGNTFASLADVTLARLALGAGLGLRIRTPLAPFRVDVAYPFSDAYGRHSVRVHFSIGQMF